MSSSIRLGARMGGRQAPRRESLFAVRYGWGEFAATLVAAAYAGLAVYLVGHLGLTTSETLARTARAAVLWDGFDVTLVGFGFERPPLLTALTAPFAAVDLLRPNGLAGALAASIASAVAVPLALRVARGAGLILSARILFVAAFALHPLLLFAGVFGLPEAIYSALVLTALAEFSRWLEHRSVAPVITSGVALGLAFTLRYNVLVLVLAVACAYWYIARDEEQRTRETEAANATAMAFAVPVVFVVGLWSLLAWFPSGATLEYVTLAHSLTMLGNESPEVLQRLGDLAGNPLAVAQWIGGWTAVIAPASILAIAALAVYGIWDRQRSELVLAGVCASVALPEAVALITGLGQARVPHLFVAIVPAFVVYAYWQRRVTRGVVPSAVEGPRRRAQRLGALGLLAASLASSGALLLMPASEAPARDLVSAIRSGTSPAPHSPGAIDMAEYLREHAGTGDVVVDIERHAEVILLVDAPQRFQTDGSEAEEATLYEPFGTATYILVRRPLAGQGPGRVERAYEDLFSSGSGALALEFESGDYRLYAVTGPAVP